MNNFVDGTGIPLGFGMALAQNPEAMEKFAAMTGEQRQGILNKAHTIRSKDEMYSYVNSLVGEMPPHPPAQF
jgi:hypothetical protein